MRLALVLLLTLGLVPAASARRAPVEQGGATRLVRIRYRAHDGRLRPAWLLLPGGYDGRPLPLVISPHERGETPLENALNWGDLPSEGNFAVINPGGEGRRLGLYSWGDPGQIADLVRMPAIVAKHGVEVERHRIYAIGGSMGGQEVLLLLARHPHFLAGVAAFDPATDMRRRYYDFAGLQHGRELQRLARIEIGGTPEGNPHAYELRSPDHFVRRIAFSGVPLQLYWSRRDRVITDQRVETGALAMRIRQLNRHAKLWDFEGDWLHTAEMQPTRRLPRALARFGLLRRADVPPLPIS